MTDISHAFLGRWQQRELVFHGAEGAEVEFAAKLSGEDPSGSHLALRYGFKVEFPIHPGSVCRVTSEYGGYGDVEHFNLSLHGDIGTSIGNRHRGPRPHELQIQTIYNIIGNCEYYKFDPNLMSIPAALDPSRSFRMDPDGFGLPTLLDDINDHNPERFLDMNNQFCKHFPEFRRIRLETQSAVTSGFNQMSRTHSMNPSPGKGIVFETREGDSIRAQQASDGAILFLGFLSQLYLPDPPRLLLIEEPEKGVYPKRLEQIVELLRRLTELPGVETPPQIIMTTHSPFLLSSFRPEEVTLMSRRGDHAIARPLAVAPNIEERLGGGEFYLGELWYNYDEEELFQDAR